LKANWAGMHKKLGALRDDNGVTITVPKNAPDKISSTIVLKVKGTPSVATVAGHN